MYVNAYNIYLSIRKKGKEGGRKADYLKFFEKTLEKNEPTFNKTMPFSEVY